jgi:putative FmdB family regulatory protein
MPMYEYECKSCRKSFEKLVRSMSERDKTTCPECGSTQVGRKLSAFAVGSEGASAKSSETMPMCGRCGGPGPCAMG